MTAPVTPADAAAPAPAEATPPPAPATDDAVSPVLRLRGERRRGGVLSGLAVGVAAVGCLAAVLLQTLPASVEVAGVMWPEGGVSRLGAMRDGRVEKLLVAQGDVVEARQPLLVVRHRLVPAEEVEALERREELLTARLDEVKASLAAQRGAVGSSESVALVRLEDELSESLVALRDKVTALREESTTVLFAPRDGRLVELRANEGAEVRPDQALATIVTVGAAYHARAYVDAALAARLSIGMPARVRLASESAGVASARAGRVRAISSLPVSPRDVDRSVVIREPMYEVEIAFEPGALAGTAAPGPGAPVGVAFELDRTTLLASMFNRFSSP